MPAAGRVIRTEADRGVIGVSDERVAQYLYKVLFPEAWQRFQAVQSGEGVERALGRLWLEAASS